MDHLEAIVKLDNIIDPFFMDKRDFNLDELLDNLSWNLIIHKVE